jgi:rhodanese-related sulfurtransferase
MTINPVLSVPPTDPDRAAAAFAERLALQTDAADVYAALSADTTDFVLVDSRSDEAWAQGHIPGAVHLPTARIPERATELLDPSVPVVTYCWGPGCNGATRAALALARQGFHVKEMLGGVEYWIREGYPLRSGDNDVTMPVDPLVGPVCGC